MKKKNIYALMAAAMTLAACSTNDIADTTTADADNVVNVAAATRATTASDDNGNAIKAFHLVNTTQRDEYNRKYEADYSLDETSSTYVMKKGSVLWCNINDNGGNKTTNHFEAYTPLTTSSNLASFTSFVLPYNQSTPALLESADWMTATATSTKAAATDGLSLRFDHQYAKLHFTVNAKDDATDIDATDILVFDNITPYYDAANKTIDAVVEPVEDVSTFTNSLISFIVSSGERLSIALPTAIAKGKQYNFNITIGHNALTISSVSVSDWTPMDLSGKNEAWNKDDSDIEYITFTADGEQGFTFVKSSDYDSHLSGFEYSVNNGEWVSIPDGGLVDAVSFGGALGNLRLRGISTTGTNGERIVKFTNNNVKVACSGDIRTLIDYTQYKTVETGNAMFTSLFKGCTQLTSAPMLPSTKLADNCYQSMFAGCSSLTIAPVLPAEELSEACYCNMFADCTSLVSPPKISATTLAAFCCQYMFEGCTALKKASVPPAEILAKGCYSCMFKNCTALTTPPVLPATDLAIGCYGAMFDGCTSLKSAPALPAATLVNECYGGMFRGCTALKTAPALPATTLAEQCYIEMFYGCTSLKTAPALPATTLADNCYQTMFNGCTALRKAPLLKAEELKRDCYNRMFSNCSNLSSVTMLATNVGATACLNDWLDGAGTSTTSRTLKLKNSSVYDAIKDNQQWNYLPDNWKQGAGGTTIQYEENP